MPNRIIKESICTSGNLDNLSPEEEVFFYRLIVNCDDYGRTDARPQILRAKCYPMKMDRITNEDVSAWLAALVREKLIILYAVEGKPFLQFITWDKHQQVRAKKSKFPAPDSKSAKLILNDINCRHMSPYSYSESESYSEAESGSESEQKKTPAAPARNLYADFEKDFGRPLSPTEYEQITQWQEAHDPDVVKEALRRAVLNGKFNMRYIDRILLAWKKANCRTLREVLEYEQAYAKAKGKTVPAEDAPARAVQLDQKRREEAIRAACDFIKLHFPGREPPEDQARAMAAEYGEDLVPDILGRLYEGGTPP